MNAPNDRAAESTPDAQVYIANAGQISGAAALSEGWAMRSVGCHWTHPKYPQAIVSTFVRGKPSAGQMESGYGAWVNFSLVGEFETRELAQQAVEALLGD